MRGLSASAAAGALFALSSACSFLNSIDACDDVSPAVSRVNERGDGDEFIAHPLAAADIGIGRVLVAFGAQSIDKDAAGRPTTSEVRLALFDSATGQPITLCGVAGHDVTLNAPGEYAYSASTAVAPLDLEGRRASALVTWMDGVSKQVVLRFVDSAGCPMQAEFRARASADLAASVVWSPAKGAILLTLTDGRDVFRAWVAGMSSLEIVRIAAGQTVVQSNPIAAVNADGRTLVVWPEDERGPQGTLLDRDGNPLGPPFDLGFPAKTYRDSAISVSVAAGVDRFAVAVDGTLTANAPSRVYVREFSAGGAPLGEPYPIDPSSGESQGGPALAYLAPHTLLATWQSMARTRTTAQLLGLDGAQRFNAVGCNEQPFALDTLHVRVPGTASALRVGGDVWIFHSTAPPSDPRGSGVALWRLPFRTLYPGTD